jgi:hypothetical protein
MDDRDSLLRDYIGLQKKMVEILVTTTYEIIMAILQILHIQEFLEA